MSVTGTRIIYDRNFLMQCRNSPLAKSPPPNMAKIPGVTAPEDTSSKENGVEKKAKQSGENYSNYSQMTVNCHSGFKARAP